MSRRLMWILWPGFLLAIPTEGIVFSLVDPAQLHFHDAPIEMSALGVYTVGFFLLWALGAASSALTSLLQASPDKAAGR